MSIVGHNRRYDISSDVDNQNFGKLFWFSGSMKRPKRSKQVQENEIIEVEINADESIPHYTEDERKHGGTYFKLNGSVSDSEISEEDEAYENDGGTWFGVSVRKRRAESMQNLLELAEPADRSLNNLPNVQERSNRNDLDFRDSINIRYNEHEVPERQSPVPSNERMSEENMINQQVMEEYMTPSIVNDQQSYLPLDESVSEDNVINQQLLEQYDAQFLEIEKLIMESFDDIDLTITSPTAKNKPKKNKRFGVDDMENEPSSFYKSKPSDNVIRSKPSKHETHKTRKISDHKSRSDNGARRPVDTWICSRPEVNETRNPSDYETRKAGNSGIRTKSSENGTYIGNETHEPCNGGAPKRRKSKSQSKYNDNGSIDHDIPRNDVDDNAKPAKPTPPINYYYDNPSKHSSKTKKERSGNHIMNGHVDKTEPSIIVSSPESGEREYQIGETIHFRVSVREKKTSPNLSSHIAKTDSGEGVEEPESSTKSPRSQAKVKHYHETNHKQSTPKTFAEKRYRYENHVQQDPKEQQQPHHKVTKKSKLPVGEVDEELVRERIIVDDHAVNDLDNSFIDSFFMANEEHQEKANYDSTDSSTILSSTVVPSTKANSDAPRLLLKRRNAEDSRSELDSSEDEGALYLKRNRSFRRSIIIEDDEVSIMRRKSVGGTSVSVAFIAINKKSGEEGRVTIPQRLKGILNFLDNMVLDDESLGLYYDSVRQLHTVFWDLKDDQKNNDNGGSGEGSLLSVLNFLVVQEWPKVMLGCLKKLKAAYPHVFKEEDSPETTVYYSGHLPSLLRMNRTTSEYAVSVIFDGLLRVAINFTDVHEASRQACCEDNLLAYLMDEIMVEMHNIKWGKATAREMFLKSMNDLIYNCAQSYSNAGYLLEHNCVDILTRFRDETFHIVDARKVDMTQLMTLSYLIDDNNYDIIVPDEGTIIRLLQFLDKSLEHSEHTHHDFYAAELAGCLCRLSGHNANKILVTRNSGQEILHKLLKYAYDDGERISACNALWNLSFCRNAKEILRGMTKLMNLLRELSASSNAALHRAAAGIIWECEDKYDIRGTRATYQPEPGHVMISYESEAQPLVIKIRDELNRKGYQVWMSNDVHERSLEDVMTKGVERASIIIVAVTRKYRLMPHAFAEADYGHTLRKRIIPIIIDVDFVPDGWLKELINNDTSFDFSRRSMFAGSLDALVDHVNIMCSRRPGVSLNEESLDGERNSDVLSWTNAEVIYWLKANNLIKSMSNVVRLNKLTGLHLIMFYDLRKETPEYYYSIIDSHLGFKDVLDTLNFTRAIDDLLGAERLI